MLLRNYKTLTGTFITLLVLSSCTSSRYSMHQDQPPSRDVDVSKVADATPRVEPRSKYGNPESYVVFGKRYHVIKTADGFRQRGIASWYGRKFHGHRTSSGETYNMYAMTAAHKSLPLPSYVRVTNLDNHRSIVVRVNDRGPFHENRIIDLSYAAAKKLGITAKGTGNVQITYIDPRQKRNSGRVTAFKTKPHKAGKGTSQSDDGQIYLQVGAYAERTNAEQMRERVASFLENGEINTGYNVENKLYRVRIGPLASAEEADRLMELLNQSGIAQTRVITD